MTKEYTLVFAPPGVKLGDVVNKLKGKLDVEVSDIEEEIKSNPETLEALNNIKATFTQPINMETITHNLPRSVISILWKNAVARCLKKLEESDKPVKILSGHLIYYSGKRHEFYSVIDSDRLFLKVKGNPRLKPVCVLLFIDDIYDMYMRLTELYSPDQIWSFLKKLERDINFDIADLSKERLSFLTMGWEIRNLLHLLSWRHLEPIIAENLALQLNARFLVWPVKQLIEPIKFWLENSQIKPIYLSHPVTDPRNERNATEKWPDFTNEINQLQDNLSKQGITLVMPTAIDELRFKVENQKYTGHLEARWPLITKEEIQLLYSKPDEAADIDHETLLRPKYWDSGRRMLVHLEDHEYNQALKCEVDAFLQVLVREIEAQIASRDFLFIYHTEGLIVYRPYYTREPRPTFSGGVDAEVKLWEDIVQLGSQKQIAFIHFEKDVQSMVRSKRREIQEEFVDTIWKLLSDAYHIERNIVENMVKNRGDIIEVENILNKAEITPRDKEKLRREFSKYWRIGKIELLRKYFTNAVDVTKGLIGVWVVKDFESVVTELPHIANFLRNGSPNSNGWEAQVENFFPDNFINERTRH